MNEDDLAAVRALQDLETRGPKYAAQRVLHAERAALDYSQRIAALEAVVAELLAWLNAVPTRAMLGSSHSPLYAGSPVSLAFERLAALGGPAAAVDARMALEREEKARLAFMKR